MTTLATTLPYFVPRDVPAWVVSTTQRQVPEVHKRGALSGALAARW